MQQFNRVVRWHSGTLRRWLGGLLVSVVLSSTPGYAADAPAPGGKAFPGQLTLHKETLAARVTGVPLKQVMAEISRLSGAKILWRTSAGTELVSVEFPALPLSEALERLLGGKNFVLFYTAAGQGIRLTQIWISAREKSQSSLLPEHHSTEAVGTPPSSPVSLPRPPRQEDSRSRQTAIDAQGPSARSEGSTRLGGESQEDLGGKPLASQAAHNNSNPQGQEAAGVARLQGGVTPSAAGGARQCVPTAAATRFVDVDGDDRADAIALNEAGITVRRSAGSRFSNKEAWTTKFSYGARGTDFADVDGDGRADMIAVNEGEIIVRRSNGSRFLGKEVWVTEASYGSRGLSFADVDGDGRADAIAFDEEGIAVRRSNGSRFLKEQSWMTETSDGSQGMFFADVDGDGLADVIAVNEGEIIVRRSNGSRFLNEEPWTTDSYHGTVSTHFADVDGDGRADAIALNLGNVTVRRSTGSQFSDNEQLTAKVSYGERGTDFADVDGDGRADAITVTLDNVTVRRAGATGFHPTEAWTTEPYYGDLRSRCVD